ncbi:MAG: SulP family inorganic anion transporter [Reichenbachiella sp.]
MYNKNHGFFDHIKNDLPASLVVFLVAVPLCLGIALASGAPLFSGIISGIVGGIVVSLISKSQLGVSGPAAGLAVIVLSSITSLGTYEKFLLAVVFAGIIQVLLGLMKAGFFAYYLPSSVIKGMMSGIGVIIFLKQIPHAFGYDQDPEGDLEFFQPDGHNTFSELFYAAENFTPGAIVISVVCLAILILWERPFMKRLSITKLLNGPLLAVIAGVSLNLLFDSFPYFSLHGDHVVSIPVSNSISDFLGQFTLPDFTAISNPKVYTVALTIAIVASMETLLSVEAADKMDPDKRITPTNRELIAQGVGNTISGLIGGLPVTQVIVRSSANVQSGAKSRASAFFHGIFLLVSAITIPFVINMIPLASLASILIMVGYKLVKPSMFVSLYKMGHSQFYSYVVTILGIVFTDLLMGIGLGLVVAILFILWNNVKSPYHFDLKKYIKGEPIKIDFPEDVTFLNKASVIKTLAILPEDSVVIIDASRTKDIHWDILELIDDFKVNAPTKGIRLELIGFEDISSHAFNK